MDFLCAVENDENEDELYLSSNAKDAYARIGVKAFIFIFSSSWYLNVIILFYPFDIALSYKFYFHSKAVAYIQGSSCTISLTIVWHIFKGPHAQ